MSIDWKPDLKYIASPYSHPDEDERARRWEEVVRAVAILTLDGHHVFSPIAHWHPVAAAHELPKEWNFWGKLDEEMIRRCDHLWVCMMDGWKDSVGTYAELKLAKEYGLEIAGFQIVQVSETQSKALFMGPTHELLEWLETKEDW